MQRKHGYWSALFFLTVSFWGSLPIVVCLSQVGRSASIKEGSGRLCLLSSATPITLAAPRCFRGLYVQTNQAPVFPSIISITPISSVSPCSLVLYLLPTNISNIISMHGSRVILKNTFRENEGSWLLKVWDTGIDGRGNVVGDKWIKKECVTEGWWWELTQHRDI